MSKPDDDAIEIKFRAWPEVVRRGLLVRISVEGMTDEEVASMMKAIDEELKLIESERVA